MTFDDVDDKEDEEDAEWTSMQLASILSLCPQSVVSRMINIIKDKRFSAKRVLFNNATQMISFLDDVAAGPGILVLDDVAAGPGMNPNNGLMRRELQPLQSSTSKLCYERAESLKGVIEGLVAEYHEMLLFSRKSPPGEFFEFVDGTYYNGLKSKLGEDAKILCVIFAEDATHLNNSGTPKRRPGTRRDVRAESVTQIKNGNHDAIQKLPPAKRPAKKTELTGLPYAPGRAEKWRSAEKQDEDCSQGKRQ